MDESNSDHARLVQLEKMSADVLFWNALAAPKQGVEIKHSEDSVLTTNHLNFGTIEMNETETIEEEDEEGGDHSNISASLSNATSDKKTIDSISSSLVIGESAADIDEPKISLSFLEEDEEEEDETQMVVLNKPKLDDRNTKMITISNNSKTHRAHLMKAFTLPREIDAGAKELFTADIPLGGLWIEPGQTIEVQLYCNNEALVDMIGFQCRWLMFDFEFVKIKQNDGLWPPLSSIHDRISGIIDEYSSQPALIELLTEHKMGVKSILSNQPKAQLVQKTKQLIAEKLSENGGMTTFKSSNGPVLDKIIEQISHLTSTESSACCFENTPAKSYAVIGRRCFVVSLCRSALAISLSAEAPKFVPAHLKILFDGKPRQIIRITNFEPIEVQVLLKKIKNVPIEQKHIVDMFETLAKTSERMLAIYQSTKNKSYQLTTSNSKSSQGGKLEEVNTLYHEVKSLETLILTSVKHNAVESLGKIVRPLPDDGRSIKSQKKRIKKQEDALLALFGVYDLSNKSLLTNSFFRHLAELTTMLMLEEYHTSLETKSFDIFNQRLTIIKFRLPGDETEVRCMTKVKVPGANEQRPNVRYGDILRFRLCDSTDEVQGRVLSVKEDMVTVQLPTEAQLKSINKQWETLIENSKFARERGGHNSGYDYDKGGSGSGGGATSSSSKSTKAQAEDYQPPVVTRVNIRMQTSRTSFCLMHQAIETFLRSYMDKKNNLNRLLFPSYFTAAAQQEQNTSPSSVISIAPPPGITQPSNNKANSSSNSKKASNDLITQEEPSVLNQPRKWVAINEKLNESQKKAIDKILVDNPYIGPSLIFGPPGTGKTMTLVESVLQILKRNEGITKANLKCKVLLCAPSEAAANVLCSQLAVHLTPVRMHRLGWWQTSLASFPPVLLKYTTSEQGVITPNCSPLSEEGKQYEVIVSSCAASGQLQMMDWLPGSFTHIIIDESCQALEPEVMVPLSLALPTTSIVLCGDPKQLGASLRSKLARRCGYGQSLQERLMNPNKQHQNNPYVDFFNDHKPAHGGNLKKNLSKQSHMISSRSCSLLDSNYRSHGDILALPSKLFYESRLIESADKEYTHSCLKWEKLPTQQPVLFYGVNGQSMAELDSPSYFNIIEANHILDIIKSLIQSTSVSVGAGDIGVIAAFRQQVLRLRKLLRENDLGSINVGQVEDFQGAECKVIIISTVIAGYDLIGRLRGHHEHTYNEKGEICDDDDDDYGGGGGGGGGDGDDDEEEERSPLGLLFSPKRFNVALTRARALVVAVGCPDALLEDPLWFKFLKKCAQQRSWYGVSCPYLGVGLNGTQEEDGTDAGALLEHISRLSLLGDGASETIYPTELSSMYDQESQWRIIL